MAIHKIEKLKTYSERREESDKFGLTDGEDLDIKNEILDDLVEKVNEIIHFLSN